MNAKELIEAVSKMTSGEWIAVATASRKHAASIAYENRPGAEFILVCGGPGDTDAERDQRDYDAEGIVALRNHAVPLLQSLISERDAALARVAELEARCDLRTTVPMVIRDLCELDPADPENFDVIRVHVNDLRLVLNERMKPCEHDFDEAPGQGYFCRNCGSPKS